MKTHVLPATRPDLPRPLLVSIPPLQIALKAALYEAYRQPNKIKARGSHNRDLSNAIEIAGALPSFRCELASVGKPAVFVRGEGRA